MNPRSSTSRRPVTLGASLLVFILSACASETDGVSADLVLTGGTVWTGDDAAPFAEAVAVQGNRILAVGSADDVAATIGDETRVIELDGRFVSPGFIDNHTHFTRAGELILGVNLLDVSDEAGLVQRVSEAAERMPQGSWIVGGLWGAYEAWGQNTTGREDTAGQIEESFRPDRGMIDSVTPNHPTVLNKYDSSEYLANGLALDAAGADCSWEGVECVDGAPTGGLTPQAARRIMREIPQKTQEQKLAEGRAALQRLAEHGVTTIHDITSDDQWQVFEALKESGDLTARIYARPTLDRWEELQAAGRVPGFGDEFLKIGGLKGFVDGIMGTSSARFYEPYLTSGEVGRWRQMVIDAPGMQALITGADEAGYWPQVHAIGDQAIDTLLTMFERTIEENGPKERRFRMIHTQVISGPEVADRMAGMDIIAEVQPYHAIDDMRWMELRIGGRSRWAYAFKTLDDAGVLLSFGSDWPGTSAAWYTSNPLHGMYAAVTRQTLDGAPDGGWFPEERVDTETALRAYTVNNAYAAGEEDFKGRIREGYLADLAVLDRNPLEADPSALKDIQVVWTIVDGTIVFERGMN